MKHKKYICKYKYPIAVMFKEDRLNDNLCVQRVKIRFPYALTPTGKYPYSNIQQV